MRGDDHVGAVPVSKRKAPLHLQPVITLGNVDSIGR